MEIKVGDKWSRNNYGEVVAINGLDVQVKNEDAETWWISKDLVEKQFNMADSTGETKTVTQTELTEILLSKPGVVMTVNFNKKVSEKDAIEALNHFKNDEEGRIAVKAVAKQILTGEERTIIGRHYHHVDSNGRLGFIDMEKTKEIKPTRDGGEYDTRSRLVDPRTVNWVIVENVKYQKR